MRALSLTLVWLILGSVALWIGYLAGLTPSSFRDTIRSLPDRQAPILPTVAVPELAPPTLSQILPDAPPNPTPPKPRFGQTPAQFTFSRLIRVQDVLTQSEPAPDPALSRLFIHARAPHILESHCRNLVRRAALSCEVTEWTVEPRADGDFHLSGRFETRFDLPQDQVVTTPGGHLSRLDLTPRSAPYLAPLRDTGPISVVELAVARARPLCAQVVAASGACRLAALAFDPDALTQGDHAALSLTLEVWLPPDTRPTAAVLAELRQMAGQLGL